MKKKVGYLKLFLLLLFIMLLGLSSISFANTLTPINQLTPDIFKLFIDELHENQAYVYVSSSSVNRNFSTFYDIVSETQIETFCNSWNNTNFSNYADYLEQCVFLLFYDSSTPQLRVVFNNNTIGERNSHIQYLINDSTKVVCYSINDNGTKISGTYFNISFILDGSITLSNPVNYSTTGFNKTFSNLSLAYPMLSDTNFESELLYCYHLPQTLYANIPSSNGYSWKWLTGNSMLNLPEPSVPSGDYNESGLGDIINSSGDNTGNINLEPIQNSLDNIQNQLSGDTYKLINQLSGDTQRLIDNQNAIAQQQHDDLTSYDEDIADDGVNDLIGNIQDTLSGDLNNSQIFSSLEETEKGFINLISGQAEDFIISWNAIKIDSLHDSNNNVLNHTTGSNFSSLNGAIILSTSSNGVIIPAGTINFSAICRENAIFRNIKEKLNIILSALCGLALIKYLYNLLLATLGIDNPYLYDNNENPEVKKSYNVNTGITTYKGFDKKSNTSWTYTSGGGKN